MQDTNFIIEKPWVIEIFQQFGNNTKVLIGLRCQQKHCSIVKENFEDLELKADKIALLKKYTQTKYRALIREIFLSPVLWITDIHVFYFSIYLTSFWFLIHYKKHDFFFFFRFDYKSFLA